MEKITEIKLKTLEKLDLLANEVEMSAKFVGDIICDYTEEISIKTACCNLEKLRTLHHVLLDKLFKEQTELRKLIDKLYELNESE